MSLLSGDYNNWAILDASSAGHEGVRDCVVMRVVTGKWSTVNCIDDRGYFYAVGAVAGTLISCPMYRTV